MDFQAYSTKPYTADIQWNANLQAVDPYVFVGKIRSAYTVSSSEAAPTIWAMNLAAGSSTQIYQCGLGQSISGTMAFAGSGFRVILMTNEMVQLGSTTITSDNMQVVSIPVGTAGIYVNNNNTTAKIFNIGQFTLA